MHRLYPEKMQCNSYHVNGNIKIKSLYSPSALTADLGDYDVRGSIDERSTGSTELAA